MGLILYFGVRGNAWNVDSWDTKHYGESSSPCKLLIAKIPGQNPYRIKHIPIGDPDDHILRLISEENIDMVAMAKCG
ncbi:MAG: hypothetical protein JW932_14130 [Deltaproteobacteria bacterium]|nr:hypothetical protein [Deltaproteobacteria bacterium]